MLSTILKNPVNKVLLIGGIVFSVSALIGIILFIRQERINRELRLRVSDLEWLQMADYHKNPVIVGKKEKSIDLSGEEYKKDLEDLENQMNEMHKILEEEEDDPISNMLLHMIQKNKDMTVYDDNLENVISTPSIIEITSDDDEEDDEIKKDNVVDIKEIEEKLMSMVNDNKSADNDINSIQEVDDVEWISDSYTLQELKDLCKKFNISNKGNKKELIKRLLENNMEIPKKVNSSVSSS